ncbi:hypothetical protein H5410_028714 [Solanum commersonii]|uniref:Uncharacterized protein n=1 Tax=Solanum commersonii TaxID=4109 RepID=A0A9J5Z8C8_SOLCO|nr:hypothetical protein H5410_028714 [Solanum commersonii]
MSDQNPFLSLKKTFFYNFFPSKAEEEACKLNNTPHVVTRELIEIRDIYPPTKIDLKNPWQIKKKITHDEVIVGKLVIPFFEIFEYILRYWTLDAPKVWRMGAMCLLTCGIRGLSVGDEIGLYWDPRSSNVQFCEAVISPLIDFSSKLQTRMDTSLCGKMSWLCCSIVDEHMCGLERVHLTHQNSTICPHNHFGTQPRRYLPEIDESPCCRFISFLFKPNSHFISKMWPIT